MNVQYTAVRFYIITMSFLFSGQGLVPKQAHKTQENATGRRSQGATTAVGRWWWPEKLASRQQVEARDPEQWIGQRNAPLRRGFTSVGTAQGRRDDAL